MITVNACRFSSSGSLAICRRCAGLGEGPEVNVVGLWIGHWPSILHAGPAVAAHAVAGLGRLGQLRRPLGRAQRHDFLVLPPLRQRHEFLRRPSHDALVFLGVPVPVVNRGDAALLVVWTWFIASRPNRSAVIVEPCVLLKIVRRRPLDTSSYGAGRGRQPSYPGFGQSLERFGRRQPGVSPHHIFDHGALVVRQAGQHRAIVIGQNQRRLLRFALGCHVSLIRQSHAAAFSGFGLILLIVLRSTL